MVQAFQLLDRNSIVPHVLLPVTQLLALSLPPFKARSPISVALISALGFLSYLNMLTQDPVIRLLLVNQWWTFLGTLEKLLFSNVEEDYHRIGRKKGEATLLPFGLEKFKWALSLLLCPRGVGWNFQVKGVPVQAGKSLLLRNNPKRLFLRHQALQYIKYYITTDLIQLYASRIMYGTGVAPELLTVRASSWSLSFLNALFSGFRIYFPLQLSYTMGSIITVYIGMYEPQVCLLLWIPPSAMVICLTFPRIGRHFSEASGTPLQYGGSGATSGIKLCARLVVSILFSSARSKVCPQNCSNSN